MSIMAILGWAIAGFAAGYSVVTAVTVLLVWRAGKVFPQARVDSLPPDDGAEAGD